MFPFVVKNHDNVTTSHPLPLFVTICAQRRSHFLQCSGLLPRESAFFASSHWANFRIEPGKVKNNSRSCVSASKDEFVPGQWGSNQWSWSCCWTPPLWCCCTGSALEGGVSVNFGLLTNFFRRQYLIIVFFSTAMWSRKEKWKTHYIYWHFWCHIDWEVRYICCCIYLLRS